MKPGILKEMMLAISLHAYDVDNGLEEKIKKPYLKGAMPYGYCNGLVLLFVDSSELALWNPSTRQYRNLPRCSIKIPKGSICCKIGMGLGYDSTHDDYKVVLIVGTKTYNHVPHDLQQVWIFGLRSNSWRRGGQDFPYSKEKVAYFGHFANGSLHWLCRRFGGDQYALVAFDVAKEIISEVSQPSYPRKTKWHLRDLHILDGSLCMNFHSYDPSEVSFYVQEKVGTEFHWRKLFSITHEMSLFSSITRNVRVLGYSTEGDKIILDLGSGSNFIVLYDLKMRCFETKQRKLVDGDHKRLGSYPFLCLENLVSVHGVRMSGRKRKNREP